MHLTSGGFVGEWLVAGLHASDVAAVCALKLKTHEIP
jgi:hypothetical protein